MRAATVSGGGSINSAIQGAQSGETITIQPGVYREQVTVTKPVTLVGSSGVWIDGECSRATGITITSPNVTVRNMGVKKTKEQGIIVRKTSSSNITIEGNTIQDFNCQDAGSNYAAGIASWYGGSGIKVMNNTITRRVEISGNAQGKGNGVWFKSNNQNPSGGGHTISGNTIYGGYDCIGGEEEGSDHGSFDKDTIIENNNVSSCWDDGIQVEGGDVNITVRNNRIDGFGSGIAFAANRIGPLYILNNTMTGDFSRPGFYGGVSCFKVGRGGSGITYVTSNDCRIPAGNGKGGDGFKQTNKGLSPIVSRKNSIVVSRYVIEFTSAIASGTSFDEDCLSTTDTGRFVNWGGKRIDNLSSLRQAIGQEANGQQNQNCPQAGAGGQIVAAPVVTKAVQIVTPTTSVQKLPTVLSPSVSVVEPTLSDEVKKAMLPKQAAKKGWFEEMFDNLFGWLTKLYSGK